MGMKLLKVEEGQSRRKVENAVQERQSLQLDQTLKKKRQELTETDDLLTASLAQIGIRGEEEERYWQEKLRPLREEVLSLEERKRQALVPLEERGKELDTRESAVLKREESASIREAETERTVNLLTDRLDDVSEREETVNENQKSMAVRRSNLDLREQHLNQFKDALTKASQILQEQTLKNDTDFAQREAAAHGREIVLQERERRVTEKEKNFVARETAIADKRETLEGAVTEMKLKYGDKLNL